jgi:glycosyltransferase involved in cell wall biosynthesis
MGMVARGEISRRKDEAYLTNSEEPERRLWVVTGCYPRPAAARHCIFAHRQMVGVRDAGWDVCVLIPNGWYPPFIWPLARAWRQARAAHVPDAWAADGIPVSDLVHQNRLPSRLSRPRGIVRLMSNALVERLVGAHAQAQRDLVLCQFALPYGPVVRDACARTGVRYAVHLRGDDVWIWPHQRPDRLRGFRETMRDASLVLAVSGAILDEGRRIAELPLEPAAVVPNGIDLRTFHPASADERSIARVLLGIPRHATVVLCVGAATERKGWMELLRALGMITRGDIVLLAVTTGPSELEITTETARLAPNVRLVARHDIEEAMLAWCYHAADMFCLPSHGEGMSNAVLEALAAGLPVVTTPVGGHPEVLRHEQEGLLVAVRSAEALAHALGALIEQPERRAAMGAAARKRAEAVGTPAEAGVRLASLLDAVLRGDLLPAETDNPYALRTEAVS